MISLVLGVSTDCCGLSARNAGDALREGFLKKGAICA